MDGRAFLDSARHLLTAPSEANWRSAVNRSYYAVLNEAWSALDRWGVSLPGQPDIDAFVLSRFDTVPNSDLLRVADALKQLGDARDHGDYSLGVTGLFGNGTEALRLLRLAQTAIDLLDQVEADPGRCATVIAAIRAVFP